MSRRHVVVLVFLLGLLGAACATSSTPPATTGDAPGSTTSTSAYTYTGVFRVVVLGSSTATGQGVTDPFNGWVTRYRSALAAQNPDNEVLNLAVAGFTTYNVLPTGTANAGKPAVDPEHNITAALDANPDAIIVNLPTEDTAQGFSVAEQLRNYATIVDTASEAGVPVWITTSQPRDLDQAGLDQLAELRDAIEATYGERALDFWSTVAADDGTIVAYYGAGDGQNLSDEGHRIVFQRVQDADLATAAAVFKGLDTTTTTR